MLPPTKKENATSIHEAGLGSKLVAFADSIRSARRGMKWNKEVARLGVNSESKTRHDTD
jgi:hypothetical protein